jgi:phage terminase small subunit
MPAHLTPKQAQFVAEYLVDLNATQAAIRAGYSARNADKIGPELLGKTRVAAAIREAQDAREKRTTVTADRVVAELAKLAFSNIEDFTQLVGGERVPDMSRATRDQLAAVAEIVVDEYVDGRGEGARDVKRVRFKLADKRAALVDLGRHLGMFVDRHEHSGPAGGPIETAGLTPEERKAAAKRMLDETFGPREETGAA